MKRSLANRQTRKTTAIEAFKEMILKPIPEKKMYRNGLALRLKPTSAPPEKSALNFVNVDCR